MGLGVFGVRVIQCRVEGSRGLGFRVLGVGV